MTIYWSASKPGFYDTQYFSEDNIPADKVEVTSEEHAALMDAQAQGKVITTDPETGGPMAIDRPTPPPPTLAEQAAVLMNLPVTVTSDSMPELEGVYRNDVSARNAMVASVAQINAGMGLPGGGETFNWPDIDNNAKLWPADAFVMFAKQVSDFTYNCYQVAGGFSQTLPSNIISVEIDG